MVFIIPISVNIWTEKIFMDSKRQEIRRSKHQNCRRRRCRRRHCRLCQSSSFDWDPLEIQKLSFRTGAHASQDPEQASLDLMNGLTLIADSN